MKTKKSLIAIIIILSIFLLTGCTTDQQITVEQVASVIRVDDEMKLSRYYEMQKVYYESSDPDILEVDEYYITALKEGDVILSCYNSVTKKLIKEFLFTVKNNKIESITISGAKTITINKAAKLDISVYPDTYEDSIIWESSDNSIVKVNNGIITGVSVGFAMVRAYSEYNNDIQDEIMIQVANDNSIGEEVYEKIITSKEEIDITTLQKGIKPIIEKTTKSIVGIKTYYKYYGRLYENDYASALVYKRNYLINSDTQGETLETEEIQGSSFVGYKYYAITNKSVVENMTKVIASLNGKEYECTVIGCDSKVNIGVISFTSTEYIPTATFGNSENVQTGEFVLAIGATDDNHYYNSGSFGIISYNQRYLSDDTDNDGVSDWDQIYIQHDASISQSSCGGALVNLKGEVIGINTLRITDSEIDNMSFAIPSNEVLKLVEFLEKGIVPTRYVLGITLTEVKTILSDESLTNQFNLPSDIKSGMYVREVSNTGLGYKSGLQKDDILLKINNVTIDFTYQIRKVLDDVSFNKVKEVELEVYRDGKIITLKVVF